MNRRLIAVAALAAVLLGCADLGHPKNRALVVVRRVEPYWPKEAIGKHGHVTLSGTVGTDGKLSNIRVIESEPAGVFDATAANAFSFWLFKPQIKDGVAVSSDVNVTIKFETFGTTSSHFPPSVQLISGRGR